MPEDVTELLPPVRYQPEPARQFHPGIAAAWAGVAILLLIAAGVAAIDWRLLGWG